MSLNIIFSSSTDKLARALAADVRSFVDDVGSGRSGFDPIRPIRIIVPNRNMEKWLRFSLARSGNIAFNLEFPYLECGLWDLVESCMPAADGGDVERRSAGTGRAGRAPMDSSVTAARIAACLLRDAQSESGEPSVLIRYCLTGGVAGSPGFCTRLWQLSERLALSFREYEFSRTTMVREWLAGQGLTDPSPMKVAQARLYREVCGDVDVADGNSGVRHVSLFRMGETAFGGAGAVKAVHDGGQPVFMFGLTSLSAYHCRLIWEISRRMDVYLYHVNNCHEFWEDATTPAEDNRWRRIVAAKVTLNESGEELDLGGALDDNPLLKAWGKAGRETVKLLAQMENAGDAETRWIDDGDGELPEGATVLQRVQHGIVARTSQVGRVPQDDSIEVWNCPGKLREVETIAERIVGLLGADPGLKLSQIAILVSDMATYKPLISQVFDRDKGDMGHLLGPLPYNLADSNASSDSLYAQGVMTLLELAVGDRPRAQVFELLYNPCYQSAVGVTAPQVDSWAARIGLLGAFREVGSDASAPAPFSWAQALTRLRLGLAMPEDDEREPAADDANPFARLYPAAIRGVDDEGIDTLCAWLEILFARLDGIRAGEAGAADWHSRFLALFDEFLAVPSDRPGESIVRDAFAEGMAGFFADGSPLDRAMAAAGMRERIPAGLAIEIVRGIPGQIPTCRGAYLSDGITVASIKPMRPIPFRVVFVAGLEEGAFPAANRESSLDLRFPGRQIGDITSTDAGRYMFLETLMATTDRLILTYDGWDTKKDATHEPCSVVRQLMDFIGESVLLPGSGADAGEGRGFIRRRVPISPFGKGYLDGSAAIDPAARRLQDRVVACMVEAARTGRKVELMAAIQAAAGRSDCPAADRMVLSSALDVLAPPPGHTAAETTPAAAAAGTPAPRVIRIRQLATFLEDPMKARLQRVFDTWEQDDDDPADELDEPFGFDPIQKANLVTTALKRRISGVVGAGMVPDDIARAVEQAYMRSCAPQAPFRAIEVAEVLEKIDGDRLARADDSLPQWSVSLQLPDAHVDVDVDGLTYRIPLDQGVDFSVRSDTESMAGFGRIKRLGSMPAGDRSGLLQPFMYAVVLRALPGAFGNPEYLEMMELSGDQGLSRARLQADRSQAHEFLSMVIREYMDDSNIFESLPYGVVCKVVGASVRNGSVEYPPDRELTRKASKLVDPTANGEWLSYYPLIVQRMLSARTVVPQRIGEVIRRRYGMLWASTYVKKAKAGS